MAEITGFIVDHSINQIVPIYDEFDIIEINNMANQRIEICQNCENYISEEEYIKCKLCNCILQTRVVRVYPLDEDGKAYNFILARGGVRHVCPLKKW